MSTPFSNRDRDPAVLVRAARVIARPGAAAAEPGDGADAVLVRDGFVRAVGRADALAASAPGAEVLELPGATLTPGLTDAHVHLLEWALTRRGVDLSRTESPAAAARAVAEAAGRGGNGWVVGRGWNAHRWAEPAHRRYLDAELPDRPVLLQSLDMHSYWGNSAALRAAGIDASTPDPDGGRIERGADGEPTGVVRENAMPLLVRAAPASTDAERIAALLDAQALLHGWGVTGVHTVEPDSLGPLESVRGRGDLWIRVLQHLPVLQLDDAIRLGLRSGFGGDWIRIGGVKMFLDGALGSCTALLREPYEGSRDRGVATLDPELFRDAVRRGTAAGLAMTVHAIGDAALDLALDVLGDPAAEPAGPVPHRIEHVQLAGADRLGAGNGASDPALRRVVCSVQPSHLMTDWRAAERHWGDRARWAYAFRSLEAAGATLALGSDAPVDPPDPRLGLYAATSRRDLDGQPADGWYPDETLTPERALAGYTTGAARAAGDPRQGRLAPGSFADLVAWDRDPSTAGPEGLRTLRPVLTMVAGRVVWSEG